MRLVLAFVFVILVTFQANASCPQTIDPRATLFSFQTGGYTDLRPFVMVWQPHSSNVYVGMFEADATHKKYTLYTPARQTILTLEIDDQQTRIIDCNGVFVASIAKNTVYDANGEIVAFIAPADVTPGTSLIRAADKTTIGEITRFLDGRPMFTLRISDSRNNTALLVTLTAVESILSSHAPHRESPQASSGSWWTPGHTFAVVAGSIIMGAGVLTGVGFCFVQYRHQMGRGLSASAAWLDLKARNAVSECRAMLCLPLQWSLPTVPAQVPEAFAPQP